MRFKMATSMCRKTQLLSTQLATILPRMIRSNVSIKPCSVSVLTAVRHCSNFKSKHAVVDGQYASEMTGDKSPVRPDSANDGNGVEDQEQPQWMLTRRASAKAYARGGKASGVDPSIMWPTRAELEKIEADEREWNPSLQQMQSEIAVETRAKELTKRKREKEIAANMARMPKLLAEHRRKQEEKREVLRLQQEKRNRLLEEARSKLGYAIDPRSPRFQKMVEEIEREERKRRKELRRKGIVV